MLSWLPGPIKGILAFLFLSVHTIFWCTLVYVITLVKYLSPNKRWRRYWSDVLLHFSENWIQSNRHTGTLFGLNKGLTITALPKLSRNQWYFLTCNHQSWTDPVLLSIALNKKVPFFKVFLKDSLKFMPFLGPVFYALEYPRLKRYSQEKIKKNPSLRGKDIQTTLRCCEKALERPTTLMSFIEGTRFTKKKHQQQNSPFEHLLLPKPGGFALTIGVMKNHITHFLLATIAYPNKMSFWDYLCGRVQDVKIHVEEIEIPKDFFQKNYLEDPEYREALKDWLNGIWERKDKKMAELLAS